MELLPKKVNTPFMASEELLPAYDSIPDEFRRTPGTKWNKLFSDWFFSGLESLDLIPKEGIDKAKALTHIKVAMQGWDSKHEHKEAGVAYLLSLWFEDSSSWTRKANKP